MVAKLNTNLRPYLRKELSRLAFETSANVVVHVVWHMHDENALFVLLVCPRGFEVKSVGTILGVIKYTDPILKRWNKLFCK